MKISARFLFIEVGLMFSFIMAQIWILPRHWMLVLLSLLAIFISWRYHKDTLKTVGLLPEDFSQAKAIFLWTIISLAVMLLIAFLINPVFWERDDFWKKIGHQLNSYLGWAVFQQLLLHGYFTNRLQGILRRNWLTAIMAGILFSVAHLPNPALSIGTLFFGAGSAYFFLKSRNLYILALVHGVLGTALNFLIAKSLLDHAMRIGPDFWR